MRVIRESKIQFEKWLYPYNNNNLFFIIVFSIAIHTLLLYLITLTSQTEYKIFKDDVFHNSPPVHVQLDSSPKNNSTLKGARAQDQEFSIPKSRSGGVLTDKNLNSKSPFYVPKNLESLDKRVEKTPFQSNLIPKKKKNDKLSIPQQTNKKVISGMESLLPQSSPSYIDQIRRESQQDKIIHGDGGDIPIIGKNNAPSSEPQIKERFASKDYSLYQFSLEFKEKFGAIWNSKDRMLPPESPLRPGDVVYYKVYIKGDGYLEKFENLTQKKNPNKDFSGADLVFKEVVTHVLPMSVPPRFAHSIVTEVMAIQVVSSNVFVQYSPQ
ncbi:hypothetical protein [Fluviispira multicolorata]|uniref:Uncharacterized protein n=1 Tax=Fluviispira multicolorata TaxID=2654512 RepID=A0A833N6E5_9BACT|nr:hypothetical protein [Fluviispira multicolorata]KAB8033325.1 hypothetical protein GCL57_01100 [Fluviispira multicolorata]